MYEPLLKEHEGIISGTSSLSGQKYSMGMTNTCDIFHIVLIFFFLTSQYWHLSFKKYTSPWNKSICILESHLVSRWDEKKAGLIWCLRNILSIILSLSERESKEVFLHCSHKVSHLLEFRFFFSWFYWRVFWILNALKKEEWAAKI